MSTIDTLKVAEASERSRLSVYRAIWRWHFFAGLLVLPLLLNLAVTGGLYLFKDEINDTVFRYRNLVQPNGAPLAAAKIGEIAELAVPGSRLKSYRDAATPDRSVIVTVTGKAGSTLVFVDPYRGNVLDTVRSDEEFNYVVKRIHSLAYFGPTANKLIEIAGGFAMVLVATGIFLWWPRRQTGGVVTIRATPSRRVFWRDLHAVTGAFTGMLIFFLAITGMPWSGVWGSGLQGWLGRHGLGYPVELWENVPKSTSVTEDILPASGWAVERAPLPASREPTSQRPTPISLDQALSLAKAHGIAPGFEIAAPADAAGVYTAAIYPDDLAKQRTIHIDQYSGTPLIDLSYEQYPYPAKAIEWGINIHQGQTWGRFNQVLMLFACLAIILLCITGSVMWWKRRPSQRIGVPPMPQERSVYTGLWAIAAVFSLAFPLTGIAIAVMIAFDLLVIRLIPPLRRVFD